MIELYKIPAHEAPLEYLNREIAPFDNSNTLVIVPTSRNLRRLLSGKYRDLQTMEEFTSRVLYIHGAALPDLLRCYYLLKAALELPEEYRRELLKTELPPDEKTFAPLLPFFRELCLEMIDPKKLAQKAQYHEYDREIRALSLLWESYVKLIGNLGYTDEWELKRAPLFDLEYLKRYDTYIFLICGYLNNFEITLIEKLSEVAAARLYFNFIGDTHRQAEVFKKRFGKTLEGEFPQLKFSRSGFELLCNNGAADSVLEITPCGGDLSQLNFITSRIMREHFESGVPLERMAVVLPHSGLAALFSGSDLYKLYSVTGGYRAEESELMRILASFAEVLRSKTAYGFSLLKLESAVSFTPFSQSADKLRFFFGELRNKGHLFIDLSDLRENSYLEEFMKAFTPFLAEGLTFSEVSALVGRFLKAYAPYYENTSELCDALEFELAKTGAAYAKIETSKPTAELLESLLEILAGVSTALKRKGGVAVMGLLESRNMQYDYLFLPDMNEGIFPYERESDLFLNSEIRRSLSLPTYADREALQINYCLELISRAKRVVITYKEGEEEGESRFITELRAAAGGPSSLKRTVLSRELIFPSSYTLKTQEAHPKKTLEALNVLKERVYSATALTCYRDCPFKFFLKYVRGVQAASFLEEEKISLRLGGLLDGATENAHRRGLTALDKLYEEALCEEFEKLAAAGSHYLAKTDMGLFHLEALKATLPELVQRDREALLDSPPLKVQTFKEQASCGIYLESLGYSVRFRGIADRVDYFKNGEYRIIDYKYKLTSKFKGALQVEDFERGEYDIQMPLYGLIFSEKLKKVPKSIYWFDMRGGAGLVEAVKIPLLEEFKDYLRKLMSEILSPGVFCRNHSDKCKYCDFRNICGYR